MSGNVREWCYDWYDEEYYKISSQFNPKGPAEGTAKVIRGGGWGYDESFLRTTDRNRWVPDDSSNEIGFRIVLEAK
jgi:formylglycine-generating enzyme required for sulfatase activity